MKVTDKELAIDCCLLAGRLMMEAGAETYRVEDTMERMARTQELSAVESFVTPTGILLSPGSPHHTKLVRIKNRSTDLEKIALVNDVSRKLSAGDYTVAEAYARLQDIQRANVMFPIGLQLVAASVASGCFLLLYGGYWSDVVAAVAAGGAGFLVLTVLHELTKVKFFAEFLAALSVALVAFLAVRLDLGTELDKIIIGGVMPLVPGLLITNAVRDLMAGHFMSGLSKGAEAFLTAFAIGAGVALVLSF
ncbi:threonine/serine exporter family protein [Sporosarcina saromensis]|uniref:Threonine/serine exporter family protein n=1 Tax=Sporosarcina saromensis TaxID=359365 RepID=A0ABU4GCC7_9BACL|nr:threonine/serine exporter family protein [Sporosarcina saromensis]MDW0113978.1 threonine/serine exporter family protein [Sporosarcina saromensis]